MGEGLLGRGWGGGVGGGWRRASVVPTPHTPSPSCRYKSLGSDKWDDDGAARWRRVARVAATTPAQHAEMMRYRGALLAQLGGVYAERARLNEEALQLLLSGAEDPELLRAAGAPSGGGGVLGLISNFW